MYADGSYKVIPRIKPVLKSLAEIYLESPLRSVYVDMKFNPRPHNFKKSCPDNELNMWSGPAIKRDDVVEYTDWKLLTLIMNHLRFTWTDVDLQFSYLIGYLASIIQSPWLKQTMCLGVNGEQGSGKTLMFLIMELIIGTRHFVHLHSMEDMFGEFTAYTCNRILVFLDECIWAGSHKDRYGHVYCCEKG